MIFTSLNNIISLNMDNGFFLASAQTGVKLGTGEIIGTWIAAILTICIFSFLYDDNPLYKFAEHLFVGVSAGYTMATAFHNVIKPNLIMKIQEGFYMMSQGNMGHRCWENLSYILPGILGVMLILKLVPKIQWIARWPLSFMVGMASGLGVVLTMEAFILKQVSATLVPLLVFNSQNVFLLAPSLKNIIIVLGVCSGLIYFYFSKEHKGPVYGTFSRFGIVVLMMAFGAAFGYTVMARVSLLIGRMLFFRDQWWPAVTALFGGG